MPSPFVSIVCFRAKEAKKQKKKKLNNAWSQVSPDSMIAPLEYMHDLKILNHLVTVQDNKQYREECCHAALIWLVTI